MGFQYPVEIPGVKNVYLLKAALNAQREARGEEEIPAPEFMKLIREKLAYMKMDNSFLQRAVNEGFSGGEKKRNEILQMLVLQPRLALLDEIDSGLDIDAMKVVAEGVNSLRGADRGILMVTHYQRLLDHIVPDVVHVLVDGQTSKNVPWRRHRRRLAIRVARNQPTEPSSVTLNSASASTANSIGSSWKTSLQKPLTIMLTASSSLMPRLLQ